MRREFKILLLLILLVPLGLLTDNPAWGEWDLEYFEKVLGYIPKGMEVNSTSLINDYYIPFLGEVGSYYLSAAIGVLLVFGFFYIIVKFLK